MIEISETLPDSSDVILCEINDDVLYVFIIGNFTLRSGKAQSV